MPTRLIMALCVGFAALIFAASYAVRTPMITGSIVAQKLSSLARSRHINLTINSYRPLGLFGLRLEEVQLAARRGEYLVEADLAAVDVIPSLDALFSGLELRPARIEVHGGRIRLTRQPNRAPEPSEPAPQKPASPKKSASPKKPAPSAPTGQNRPLHAILHDVSVSVRLAPLPDITRPLVVHRADFVIKPGSASTLDFSHAYGKMPDGVPFVVKKISSQKSPKKDASEESAPEITYVFKPNGPTRIDRWFDVSLPFAVSTDSLSICPRCAPATVELRNLEVARPGKFRARSDSLSLSAGKSEVRVSLAEVTASAAGNVGDKARKSPYRLTNFEMVYDARAHTTIVQGQVEDAESGSASFAANWSAQWGVLESHILLSDFHTAGVWPMLGLGAEIQAGAHSGEVEAVYEPALDLLEFSLDLKTRDLVMALPVVTAEPLEFDRLGLEIQAIFQPRARTMSVSSGQARLGGAGPVRFYGYALDAGDGLVFDVSVRAEKLHPQKLRDGLPPRLAKLARGTKFEGEFGFAIETAGNTTFPKGITLSVDFMGEVEVFGDSSYADILALAGGGPPSIDLPGTLVQKVSLDAWIDYDSLPERTPMVLAAAEDAKFFKHDGFDWGGLRRALAYNVKAGGIERGGSTLSQQLSKNLFLDHDRTLARKLQEAYVTWRLEAELSKERIMELYTNVVEWGPGIQGIREAAQRYFAVPAEKLSVPQTALLAAVLPGPSLFGRQVLNGYLPSSRLEKIEHILSNLRFMNVITPREYDVYYDRATRGWIDDLKLTVCDDDSKAPEGTPKCP